ncbi:DNA replication/repair protein RecF [Vannielia litorea]|uniref:DNA replication/repair protein RecF n=1 Tax=Vannielia litorea TaxID=1217970 RepID=UPI001C95E97E|nr:DNA replication/repair protein RecF [Vannielia litorea]MBY6049952.1 DNA replication/repair protein RecF [Vannielia litorea]MBY6077366.1 DNA replication/repair protein RecF [Vannielia litorea]
MPRLALTSLTLSHFRSHRRAELVLDGRPVALWGPNGAGKTNVLEAVSMLSPGRGLRRASAEEMARAPEALGWKVKAELASLGHMHELETWADAGATGRAVKIDGKAAAQVALGRLARVVWLVPSMDRLWIEGAEGRRRFLDRIVLSFEPAHGEAVLAYEKAMRERNRLLKDMVRDAHWYAALEARMGGEGARIHRNREEALTRLAEAQGEADGAFPAAELVLTHPEPACDAPGEAEALTAALAEGRARDLTATRTLTGPHRADLDATYIAKGTPARLCSTGEQKALLLSLILANARALAEDFGAPPLLLLDEVAAHLDAGRRAALYAEIERLGAQAFMTGTGAELFEELGGKAQHFEVTEEGGVSTVSEVTV